MHSRHLSGYRFRQWGLGLALLSATLAAWATDGAAVACNKPVYLTVDPGNMDFAPRVADVLRRQQVPVTFWVSNQNTRNGEGSLGRQWSEWWTRVGQQGHTFASQTYDHVLWRADLPGFKPTFRMQPTSGALAGREFTYDPPKYCEQITRAAQRIEDFTGKKTLPLFHAPGGSASPKLHAAAAGCGFAHVAVARGGVLANGQPLQAALAAINPGDVLKVELNAKSGSEVWAVSELEPLLVGLKGRGLCFESLRRHPAYKDWFAAHGG